MISFCRLLISGSKSSMLLHSLSNFITVVIGILMLISCSGNAEGERITPAAPVIVSAAVMKDMPVVLKAIGTVEPYNTVDVRARVAGEIIRIAFKEGQDVSRQDLLFTIDPRPYEAALEGPGSKSNLVR